MIAPVSELVSGGLPLVRMRVGLLGLAPDLGLMEVEEAGDAVVGVGDGAAVSGTGE